MAGHATGNAPVVTHPIPGDGMMNWDGRMKTEIGQTNGSFPTSARHKTAGKREKWNITIVSGVEV